jgi:MFS family permease
MGVVQNLAGFFVARFFLGVTESGLFPGVVYYFSMWYKRRERQFRISLFFSAAALAGSFGGILAYVSCRHPIFSCQAPLWRVTTKEHATD